VPSLQASGGGPGEGPRDAHHPFALGDRDPRGVEAALFSLAFSGLAVHPTAAMRAQRAGSVSQNWTFCAQRIVRRHGCW
jgi:hypothetical protein